MRASKNTSEVYKHHQVGLRSEELVAQEFLSKGYQIVARRLRTPYAEIDILAKKNQVQFMVEVKSLGRMDFSLVRVTTKQKERLLRAREWLEGRSERPVALAFAYVLRSSRILIFNSEGDAINLEYEI